MGRPSDAAVIPEPPFPGCPQDDNAYEQLQAYWRLSGLISQRGDDDEEEQEEQAVVAAMDGDGDGARAGARGGPQRNARKWSPVQLYAPGKQRMANIKNYRFHVATVKNDTEALVLSVKVCGLVVCVRG